MKKTLIAVVMSIGLFSASTAFGQTVYGLRTAFPTSTTSYGRTLSLGRPRFSDAQLRLALATTRPAWQVGLRGPAGTFTATYSVNNSAQAMSFARKNYPNAYIVGVRKVYR